MRLATRKGPGEHKADWTPQHLPICQLCILQKDPQTLCNSGCKQTLQAVRIKHSPVVRARWWASSLECLRLHKAEPGLGSPVHLAGPGTTRDRLNMVGSLAFHPLAPRRKGRGYTKAQERWEAGWDFSPGLQSADFSALLLALSSFGQRCAWRQPEGGGCSERSLSCREQAAWVPHSIGSHVYFRGPCTWQVLNNV